MITKEMIEDAANDYVDSFFVKEKEYNKVGRNKCTPNDSFKAGAEYAIQQMNNDAVEFAEWVHNADWYYIKERNYWVTGNGIDELESKEFHPRITRTSQELYQLYLKTKK